MSMSRHPSAVSRSAGFTLIELLVVITILSSALALLLPAIQSASNDAAYFRSSSNPELAALAVRAEQFAKEEPNNLKQMGIALHSYHDAYKHLEGTAEGERTAGPALVEETSRWLKTLCETERRAGELRRSAEAMLSDGRLDRQEEKALRQFAARFSGIEREAHRAVDRSLGESGLRRSEMCSGRHVASTRLGPRPAVAERAAGGPASASRGSGQGSSPSTTGPPALTLVTDGTSNTLMVGEHHRTTAGKPYYRIEIENALGPGSQRIQIQMPNAIRPGSWITDTSYPAGAAGQRRFTAHFVHASGRRIPIQGSLAGCREATGAGQKETIELDSFSWGEPTATMVRAEFVVEIDASGPNVCRIKLVVPAHLLDGGAEAGAWSATVP